MSAYVVTDEQISTIVSSLYDSAKSNSNARLASMLQHAFRKSEFALESGYLDDLALAMYNMNVNAVSQRYPDSKEVYGGFKFKFVSDVGRVQTYKYLQSFLYQCSEGNVREHPLYLLLNNVLTVLAKSFIESTPEYDKAKW